LPQALVRIDIPIFVTGRRVGRIEGAAMVCAYLVFLAFLLATQT
jgi:cation:H+ antiporter